MLPYFSMLLIVCPLVFCAGIVDAAAGGGGLISLPAYIFAGIPIQVAYGTNKFANCIGTSVASVQFLRSGHMKLRCALLSVIGALVGSWFGTQLVLILDEKYLKYCLLIILPGVAVFMLFNRRFGAAAQERTPEKRLLYPLAAVIGLVIGAYDGFFGPGTGTFLILAFTSLLGFSLITASGNAKAVNLASNLSALIAYSLNGKVLYTVGLPAALCAVAGNYLGARLAIKNGAAAIKPLIILVVLLLLGKVVASFF